jgi:excisionase family DNA binding protein
MADRAPPPADWRTRSTISVDDLAVIMGVSRSTAYAAVKAREVPAIRLGRCIRVPVAPLIRQLEGE